MEECDLTDMERRLSHYREMYSVGGLTMKIDLDREPGTIRLDSLQIELIAGGLSKEQQNFILSQIHTNQFGDVFGPITILFYPNNYRLKLSVCAGCFVSVSFAFVSSPVFAFSGGLNLGRQREFAWVR